MDGVRKGPEMARVDRSMRCFERGFSGELCGGVAAGVSTRESEWADTIDVLLWAEAAEATDAMEMTGRRVC